MSENNRRCSDCDRDDGFTRRDFIRTASVGAFAAVAATTALDQFALAEEAAASAPETAVKALYDTLTDAQKKSVCFAWDHMDPKRGLLRTRVANNWHITDPTINSDFFTDKQRGLIREIFEGLYQKDWHSKIDQQLKDDAGGFGKSQNIAIFGTPGSKQFEFVMTGRHMTIRCDGNSAENIAFGGPIFYGHQAGGDDDDPAYPGNVFWEQGIAANKVFEMLDGKQREKALVAKTPREQDSGFQGKEGKFPGLSVGDMTADQQALVQAVLKKLIEPYRTDDQKEVLACLEKQGGLTKCSLAFYSDEDIGKDKVWDNWRLEGPSFVWYFRGSPHVHVWVNVASDASIKLNA